MTDLKSKILKTHSRKLEDIAQVAYHLFYKEYSYENGRWIHLVDGEWVDDGDGLTLRQEIGTVMVKSYVDIITEYNSTAFDQDDEGKDKHLTIARDLTTITHHLKVKEYQDKLLCNCASLWSRMKLD